MSVMGSKPDTSPTLADTQEFLESSGSLFLAAFFSTILYGITLHQAYRYLRTYPSDRAFIKFIVIIVLAVETAYTICDIHYCYFNFVAHYNDPKTFENVIWSGTMLPLLWILTGTSTHIFFIRRVSMIESHYKLLAFAAVLFHAIQDTCGLVLTVEGFIVRTPSVFVDREELVAITFGSAILADISITSALCVVMYQGRRDYARRHLTKSVADTITVYFINTGALILVLDIVTAITATAKPGVIYWAAIYSVTSRVYTNTLFSVLNSRMLQAEHGIKIFSDGPLRSISRANRLATLERWNLPQDRDPAPRKIAINVCMEVEDEGTLRAGWDSGERTKPNRLV
ncbi:hypothetical protein C8Q76DRAFT_8359 [Earliella scabrosa]|nr:hypothetical protein C8Q76DRAFT_8359 [Earliella scabrosa]